MLFHVRSQWLKFHEVLLEADVAAMAQVRSAGCLFGCGGRLHVANYPRKGRGLDDAAERAGRYDRRLSLCCSREGCRRRATPPSVRFLGRRIFVAVLVIAASVTAAATRAAIPPASLPPSRQTRGRWQAFWREQLARSAMYIEMIGARVAPAIDPSEMPEALVERCAGDAYERFELVLRLLAPWTTISVSAETARSVMVR